MKSAITVIALFCSCLVAAQTDSLSKNKDTLYLASGYKIVKGLPLKIGTGSTPTGSFKFIRYNSASLFAYTSNTPNAADNANSLERNCSGLSLNVNRIEKRGSKKMGFVYYPIIKRGILGYEVDINNAIASGEIAVPDEFKPKEKQSQVIIQKSSSADEIMKYKKMMDDGIITKDEFEAKKKKLLEENN